MQILDPVDLWIGNVSFSHSQSKGTEDCYRFALKRFCKFIDLTPGEIIQEYEFSMNERAARKKYSKFIQSFIIHLTNEGYAVGSTNTIIGAVKSFFKYSDLPLGYIPQAKNRITYHNRDITHEEIKLILAASTPRDRAFFSIMIQGGLRPGTITELKMNNLEPDFSNETIPCSIHIPSEITKGQFGSYFTFIGKEAVSYLKAYLSTRTNTAAHDYVFLNRFDQKVNRRSITNIFARTIDEMKKKGILDFDRKKAKKPRSLRLYSLRKYFRKHAGQGGVEYVNFWMGHKTNYRAPHIPASDEYYFDREDVEFQRKIYEEKAMPHLKLESFTPSMTEKMLEQQRLEIEKIKKENQELRETIDQLKEVDNDMRTYLLRTGRELEEKMKKIELLIQKHPEIED